MSGAGWPVGKRQSWKDGDSYDGWCVGICDCASVAFGNS